MDTKRPTPKETDEDLLKMQSEFLSSKFKPSTSVVKPCVSNDKNISSRETIPSRASVSSTIAENKLEDATLAVLANIMERMPDPSLSVTSFPTKPPTPFPQAFKRSLPSTGASHGPKKKSIFGVEMNKWRAMTTTNSFETCLMQEKGNLSIETHENAPQHSNMVHGSGLNSLEESQNIHEENMKKIESMTREEIEEHQKQLLNHLDPKIIEFLKAQNKRPSAILRDAKKDNKSAKSVKFSTDQTDVVENSEQVMDIDEKTLPINPEQIRANKWLGMNKIEWKKMEWMKTLPEPKPFDPETGNTARFDLEGNLVTGKTDVPVHLGLHHHGDEPEKPGYSFEELFRLTRSNLPAQRCLALSTMSHILSKNSKRAFDNHLTAPLLPLLIESGLVMLLRCALDDEHASVWNAAISVLHSLVVAPGDEEALDQVFTWTNGYWSPFLCPFKSPIIAEIDNEEEEIRNTKDHEIVEKDVILGLLRMDLLPRLRYILEILAPDNVVVKNVLEILVRVARHSPQLSNYVYNCPRLIPTILSSFLPLHWTFTERSNSNSSISPYGIPSMTALKVFRILASADAILAQGISNRHQLDNQLRCYLSLDLTDDRIPPSEMLKLCVEALRTWNVLLHYGLTVEIFLELFPLWMNRLKFCQNLNANDISHRGDLIYASVLISTLTAFMENVFKSEIGIVEEGHLTSVVSLVIGICRKWTNEMIESNTRDMSEGWAALAAALCFLQTFFENCKITNNQRDVLQLKLIVEKCLTPPLTESLSRKMKSYSSLLAENDNSEQNSTNLPKTGAIVNGKMGVTRVLQSGTIVPFQISLSRALLLLTKTFDNLNENVLKLYFDGLHSYVTDIFHKLQSDKGINSNWFNKFEIQFLVNISLSISHSKQSFGKNIEELYHDLSLLLPSPIFEHLNKVHLELILEAIFNPKFYKEASLEETRQQLSILSMMETQAQLYNELNSKHLSNIKSEYTMAVNWRYENEKSNTLVHKTLEPSKLSKINPSRRINPVREWIFLPLTLERDQIDSSAIERCLSWIYYLIKNKKMLMTKIFMPGKLFCNIATIFLLDGQLFLVPEIKNVLSDILTFFLNNWPTPNFSEKEIKFPVAELFEELITQFEVASYGDKLFSNYLALFLQSRYPKEFRISFLKEHPMALRFFRLTLTECMLPVELFLMPLEIDEGILEMYFQALLGGKLLHSPLLYSLALHQVHHYLFTAESGQSAFKTKSLKTIDSFKDKMECCDNLLKFKEVCLITRTLKFHENVPQYVNSIVQTKL